MAGIERFLRDGRYDVVTMNELNGFNAAKLASLGQRIGMPHAQVLQKSAYHLGVLSRHPLTVLAAERGQEFAHGLLCVEVLSVALCVAHLNPHDVKKRAREAQCILHKHAQPRLRRQRPFMLVGDLNTLSPLDRRAHDTAGLTKKIQQGPYAAPLSKKFLTKKRDAVDYTPMQTLLDGSLTDVGVGTGYSVPTSINADHMHFATLRLDYCLRLSPPHAVRAALLRDERTTSLSDHFPLEVSFTQSPLWDQSF